MRLKKRPVDDGTPCVFCGKSGNGPFSGEALLGAMKTVHTKCYPAWQKQRKIQLEAGNRASKVLNDFFGKL